MKKKVWLSLFIVVSFVAYAILQSLNKINGLFRFDDNEREVERTDDEVSVKLPLVTQPTAPVTTNTQSSQPKQPAVANNNAPVQPTAGAYKDGQYVGDVVDVYYGNIQVKAVIQADKIIDVQFLDYPQDRNTSQAISAMALPTLRSEAISAQTANVNGVSGATETSQGFILSLRSALAKAKS